MILVGFNGILDDFSAFKGILDDFSGIQWFQWDL